ncbi:rCG20349 [Rattus norvegicus]|uniref:RCG20349 n=1 Tax=Rattus norvegicus TaxID=10116 RepID=A6JGW1_RAT|nr:rCG20349 [Rattus norvegicus]
MCLYKCEVFILTPPFL